MTAAMLATSVRRITRGYVVPVTAAARLTRVKYPGLVFAVAMRNDVIRVTQRPGSAAAPIWRRCAASNLAAQAMPLRLILSWSLTWI